MERGDRSGDPADLHHQGGAGGALVGVYLDPRASRRVHRVVGGAQHLPDLRAVPRSDGSQGGHVQTSDKHIEIPVRSFCSVIRAAKVVGVIVHYWLSPGGALAIRAVSPPAMRDGRTLPYRACASNSDRMRRHFRFMS